jgi:hypothetical protein
LVECGVEDGELDVVRYGIALACFSYIGIWRLYGEGVMIRLESQKRLQYGVGCRCGCWT